MSMEWTPSLSTGIVWQDRQHRELFKKVNALLDAIDAGIGQTEVVKLLDFLDEYFVVHFEAEEQAMNLCNYPDTLAHLTAHTNFIDEMSRLKAEAAEHVTHELVIHTQLKVADWFVNHIANIDKKLGEYILKGEKRRKGRG